MMCIDRRTEFTLSTTAYLNVSRVLSGFTNKRIYYYYYYYQIYILTLQQHDFLETQNTDTRHNPLTVFVADM